ncbi:MAG: hypothetical protein EOO11_17720 [Chitinophagaceae bacterium]|nr:MAG: hypothetical protein EOO11_17720 [Chitinophagaceae bacterium]
MHKKGLARIIGTLPFLAFAFFGFFKVLPSGITWKIAAASIGALIAVSFFVLALVYRKKP